MPARPYEAPGRSSARRGESRGSGDLRVLSGPDLFPPLLSASRAKIGAGREEDRALDLARAAASGGDPFGQVKARGRASPAAGAEPAGSASCPCAGRCGIAALERSSSRNAICAASSACAPY